MKRPAEVRQHQSGSDHDETLSTGVRIMADRSQYNESAQSGKDNWQSLGDVAQRLVRKAGAQ